MGNKLNQKQIKKKNKLVKKQGYPSKLFLRDWYNLFSNRISFVPLPVGRVISEK